MTDTFKVGDLVGWNSEAGHISGMAIHEASADAPQYESKSSTTEPIAFHKGSALTKLRD